MKPFKTKDEIYQFSLSVEGVAFSYLLADGKKMTAKRFVIWQLEPAEVFVREMKASKASCN